MKISMKKITLTALLGILIPLFTIATPASAHVSVQTYGEKYYAGGGATLFLRVPHAKPGLNTVKFVVQLPESIGIVKPARTAGWVESTTLSADGKNTEFITWDQGSLPDSSFQDFGMRLTLPNTPGKVLYFKAVQYFSDGSTEGWVEIPTGDGKALSLPAPSFTINDKASAVDLSLLKSDLEAMKSQLASGGSLEAILSGSNVNVIGDYKSSLKRKSFTITNSKGALLYTGKFNAWGDFDITIRNKNLVANDQLILNATGLPSSKVVIK